MGNSNKKKIITYNLMEYLSIIIIWKTLGDSKVDFYSL